MVDAADHEKLEAAKNELHNLLEKPQLAGIPVIIFNNWVSLFYLFYCVGVSFRKQGRLTECTERKGVDRENVCNIIL